MNAVFKNYDRESGLMNQTLLYYRVSLSKGLRRSN